MGPRLPGGSRRLYLGSSFVVLGALLVSIAMGQAVYEPTPEVKPLKKPSMGEFVCAALGKEFPQGQKEQFVKFVDSWGGARSPKGGKH